MTCCIEECEKETLGKKDHTYTSCTCKCNKIKRHDKRVVMGKLVCTLTSEGAWCEKTTRAMPRAGAGKKAACTATLEDN